MKSSEKVRVFVFSLFLFALMVFAVAYRPIDAVSHPADQTSAVSRQGSPEN